MRIVNTSLLTDLENEKPLRLDLGSGNKRGMDAYTVDLVELQGVDVVADLNEPLSEFPDDCAEYVHSRHAMEHIDQFLPLMEEIHRITKSSGKVEIVVPHFSNPHTYSDPTHIRFFGLYSMYYFCDWTDQPVLRRVPAFYTNARFYVDSVRIEFYHRSKLDKLMAPFLHRLVNRGIAWQEFYERRVCNWIHAWQIRYVLRPKK